MKLGEVTIARAGARQAAADYARTARSMPEGEQRREFERIAYAYRMAAKEDKPIISLTSTMVSGGLRQGTVVHGKGREWESRSQYLLPKLAVCKADAAFVYTLGVQSDGALELVDSLHRRYDYRSGQIRFPGRTFPTPEGYTSGSDLVGTWASTAWTAMVPIVPPKHRPPKSSTLASYLVLWEVDDWRWHSVPRPPGDPALLKHLAGDLYLVLATWDLTELEQLVLSGRRP
jgi:hypothetical protein